MPTSGKVIYWPELETATGWEYESRRPLKYQDGVVRLMSGETVDKLIRVEHGGFVLVLSSGRLVYLSLQSRSGPEVYINIFSSEQQSRGLLGGLKSLYGGAWRNTIAGVRVRTKSNRFEVISLSQEGALKMWDVEYDGSASFKDQFDLMADVRDSLADNRIIDDDNKKTQVTFIDFALTKRGPSAVSRKNDDIAMDMVALVASHDGTSGRYQLQLAHISITSAAVAIERFTLIGVYAPDKIDASAIDLTIPDPGHSAFITTPNCMILVSLERIYHDVRENIHKPIYQDIVYFQYKLGAEIIASAPEFCAQTTYSRPTEAGLLIFTKNSGAVRVTANRPPIDLDKQRIGPRVKIEQEVFFGKHANRILDFASSGDFNFQRKEVEDAALELSRDILKSQNPNIPDNVSSMGVQIYWRQEQLRRLIDYVMGKYSPISKATRWMLLWDAEKLEAAGKLWDVFEQWQDRRDGEEKILFPLVVAAIPEKDRTVPREGDVDAVRCWFTRDVDRIGKMLNQMEGVIMNEWRLQNGKWDLFVQFISEAQDMMKALLLTAYEYRNANLAIYGLDKEPIKDGILKSIDDYAGLPEPWTATRNVCSYLGTFVTSTTSLLANLSEEVIDETSTIDAELLASLRKHQWQLVLIACFAHTERGRWAQSRIDEAEVAAGKSTLDAFERTLRPDMLLGLAELGRATDGMKIAEKVGDMDGLVRLCLAEIEYLTDPDERIRLSRAEATENELKKKDLYERLNGYFTTYGEKFAYAFFTAEVDNGRFADLLMLDFGKGQMLTQYLRSDMASSAKARDRRWTKFAWVNEITRERDLKRAGEMLLKMAVLREPNAWARDRELGLAKLSFIAAEGKPGRGKRRQRSTTTPDPDDDPTTDKDKEPMADVASTALAKIERQKTLADQESKLRQHLSPTFRLATGQDPSDESEGDSRAAIAMKEFGANAVRDRPHNAALLEQCFDDLAWSRVLSPESLIDTFTLMDDEKCDEEVHSLKGKLFVCALKCLWATGWFEGRSEEKARGEMMRNCIWKRLFVRDDWVRVHHGKGRGAGRERERDAGRKLRESLLFETLRLGALESEFCFSFLSLIISVCLPI